MIIRNWKYFTQNDETGNLRITKNQYMTGNILGIIAEKVPMISKDGNLLNAKSYSVPVRIKLVDKYDGKNYEAIANQIRESVSSLEIEGCRGIITSGGNMGLFDDVFHESSLITMTTPVYILDFVLTSISSKKMPAIISELNLNEILEVMSSIGISGEKKNRCVYSKIDQSECYLADGNLMNEHNNIGAFIWDSKEDYRHYLNAHNKPVYDYRKLAKMIIDSVAHVPYSGLI